MGPGQVRAFEGHRVGGREASEEPVDRARHGVGGTETSGTLVASAATPAGKLA